MLAKFVSVVFCRKSMILKIIFVSVNFKTGVYQCTCSCLQCRCQYLRHIRQILFLVHTVSLQDTITMIKIIIIKKNLKLRSIAIYVRIWGFGSFCDIVLCFSLLFRKLLPLPAKKGVLSPGTSLSYPI